MKSATRLRGWNAATLAALVTALAPFAARAEQPDWLTFAYSWHAMLAPGDPSRLLADAGVSTRKVGLGGETRNGFLAGPTPIVATIDVPPGGGSLELSYALSCSRGEVCAGRRFVAELRKGDGPPRAVLRHAVRAPTDGWVTKRVEVKTWLGDKQVLTLRAEPLPAGPAAGDAMPAPVWGDPLWVGRPAPPQRPHVLLISIDTLRADRLGAYGYERSTSPNLDALAAEGVRFTQAISQSPWTTPAHTSMLTGLYPSAHGVNGGFHELLQFRVGQRGYRLLPHDVPTLASALRSAGYQTRALTSGGNVGSALGFARGFDVFRENDGRIRPETLDDVLGELSGAGNDVPLFFFFHTFEVHAPYGHVRFTEDLLDPAERAALSEMVNREGAEGWNSMLRDMVEAGFMRPEVTSALYDGGIHYTDAFLGRLFAALEERGWSERMLVVVTSDHGEEFADHDPARFHSSHCDTLYDELVRVPLILRLPGVVTPGRVIDAPVELVDVAPTILDLVGLPPLPGAQGRSVAALASGASDRVAERTVLSEATCVGPEWKAIRRGRHAYIAAYEIDGTERSGLRGKRLWQQVFDVEKDPRQQNDLAPGDEKLTRSLAEALKARMIEVSRSPDEDAPRLAPNPELLERLRALGYVE